MICTSEERAALMAAVEALEEKVRNFLYAINGSAEELTATEEMIASRDAIRAMLAPDNAVVIPRALAERAAENLEISANEFSLVDMMDAANERQADADALRAVLRGEATRDE